ncbi:MAG: hypothetical protein ABSH20_18045 [Tepidisphaeraceae bacterium]|jgi:hypothetical protein
MRRLLALGLAIALFPVLVMAQPLADRVPANAILMVSWQGTEHMPQAYERSHLKRFLDASAFRQVFDDYIPRLIERVGQEDKKASEQLKLVASMVSPMFRHPTAVYFAGVNFDNPGGPVPRLALMCQAGAETEALAQKVDGAMKAGPPPAVPIRLIKRGDVFAVAIGYDKDEDAVVDAPQSLASSAAFKEAMGQVVKEPVAMVYVDFEAAMALFEKAVMMGNDEGAKTAIPKIKQAIGFDGLKRFAWSGGFDGQDYASAMFIAAPAPRAGLLAMLESAPLGEDALKAIPATATSFAIARFDLGKLVKILRAGAVQVDPNIGAVFDQGVGGVQMATGINAPMFFNAIGDTWVVYSDPAIAGNGPLGTVVVNRLRDADEASRSMKKLEVFADNLINGNIPPTEKMHVSFEQVQVGDTTVHYVALPVIAPSWAIKDGNLYLGLYPQVVTSAAQAPATGKSILDNPAYVAVRKRLGVEQASGLSFADLPQTAGETYPFFLLLTQTAGGFGDFLGVKSPPMILPTLAKLKEQLVAAGSVSWTDDAGWHSKSIEPFPCATIMASQSGLLVGGGAMVAAVAVPAASKARQSAQLAVAANDLRQVGVGLMMYSTDHQGKFPADLGQLVLNGYVAADALVSPRGKKVPVDVSVAKPEVQAAWVNANTDYVYLGSGLNANAGAGTILAHEKPEGAPGGRISLLFGDGHVELLPVGEAVARVKKQTGK